MHQKILRLNAAAIATAITLPAIAQDAPSTEQATPPPPCTEKVYRAFDFWLGNWEVYGVNADGEVGDKAGDNIITSEEGGCMLLEKWTSVSGGTGQSYNYYDPGLKKWRQIWVSSAATIDYAGGLNDEGEMVLKGEIAYRNSTVAPFKGIWTALPDGSVRQHFEQYNIETKEWAPWFTGLYKRQEKAAATDE